MHIDGRDSKLPLGRRRLSALVRRVDDVIQVDDAVEILGLDRASAARVLARWTSQGWLRRVARGTYVPAPVDSLESEHVIEDPWVLVPALFGPAYVGGRTACEHWDLTEQIFNDIVVMTTRTIRERTQIRHGTTFTLKHIGKSRLFGTKPVWRGHTKVQVSDVHRTLVDIMDEPLVGGGIHHVADCLNSYLKRSDRDDDRLLAYADQLGNGAVFKRLGFLTEGHPHPQLTAGCRARLTKGNAKLDPSLDCPRLVSRWKLWIPASWQA